MRSAPRRSPAIAILVLTCSLAAAPAAAASSPLAGEPPPDVAGRQTCSLNAGGVAVTLTLERGTLVEERIGPLRLDGDFALEVMWTGWRAPGRAGNADNLVTFTAADFALVEDASGRCLRARADGPAGAAAEGRDEAAVILLRGRNNPFQVRLAYECGDGWVRRRLAVRDTTGSGHFLHRLAPRRGTLELARAVVERPGGFGQPVVLVTAPPAGHAGPSPAGFHFLGIEDPAGENALAAGGEGRFELSASQLVGERIGPGWLEGDPVVAGATGPDFARGFDAYLHQMRERAGLANLDAGPYLLYNSWYDVRAPEYTDRPEDVMNEANVLRIARDFARVRERWPNLALDCFVLDDGWDVYRSDWVLREAEFPRGLRPLSDALATMDCDLGIWFGPIGGYSHRDWRVGWMTEHGYEAEGDQLCVAGTRYHELLKRRVVDFVREHGVAYFKWDGVQFSCSEPDHGHPVGLYSRRAVLAAMADLCAAVRAENGRVFLNITSGTWLSPWWLRYADTIWMQGYDYGYADVPSLTKRDAAMTYRDYVLYEDFGLNRFIFPLWHLMTHGIIKGHLQQLGGEAEPLDRFTDNAVLYVARGVGMWELYVSPNLLTDDEWRALDGTFAWGRDNAEVLRHTVMIGGDPGAGEIYGYAHWGDRRSIVALRNPSLRPGRFDLDLPGWLRAPLVVERVYPTRRAEPRFHHAGERLTAGLAGGETAIYEIRAAEPGGEPLLAGVTFETVSRTPRSRTLRILEWGPEDPVLLHPRHAASMATTGAAVGEPSLWLVRPVAGDCPTSLVPELLLPPSSSVDPLAGETPRLRARGDGLEVACRLDGSLRNTRLAILLEPDVRTDAERAPAFSVRRDGRELAPQVHERKGSWSWITVPLEGEGARVRLDVRPPRGAAAWRGGAEVWLLYEVEPAELLVTIETLAESAERPLPPRPRAAGRLARQCLLGTVRLGDG